MIFSEDTSFKISTTASQTSAAYSSSVPVKLSGEYSKDHFVSGLANASSFTSNAPSVAIFLMPSLS